MALFQTRSRMTEMCRTFKEIDEPPHLILSSSTIWKKVRQMSFLSPIVSPLVQFQYWPWSILQRKTEENWLLISRTVFRQLYYCSGRFSKDSSSKVLNSQEVQKSLIFTRFWQGKVEGVGSLPIQDSAVSSFRVSTSEFECCLFKCSVSAKVEEYGPYPTKL